MGRLHSDMSLQLLENKALSWGISGTSAPILAEITIRKSQEFTFELPPLSEQHEIVRCVGSPVHLRRPPRSPLQRCSRSGRTPDACTASQSLLRRTSTAR